MDELHAGILSSLSQFFQSRLLLSSQATLHSTAECHHEFVPGCGLDAVLLHQFAHPLLTDTSATGLWPLLHSRPAVLTFDFCMNAPNVRHSDRFTTALARCFVAFMLLAEVAAVTDLQHRARHRHGINDLHLVTFCTKYVADFFAIFRSMCNRAFSARRRATSI